VEYKRDRPAEYAELVQSGELRKRVTTRGPSRRLVLLARVFGFTFLAVGVTLVALIISSIILGYR
jgi:hypothetical protein